MSIPAEAAPHTSTLDEGAKLASLDIETTVARLCGTNACRLVARGYSALQVALGQAQVRPGDVVLVPALAPRHVAEAVVQTGARLRFVDVEPHGGLLDPLALENADPKGVKSLVAVHLHGQPAEMRPIAAMAQDARWRVVEDVGHAMGATYHGRPVGSFGDFARVVLSSECVAVETVVGRHPLLPVDAFDDADDALSQTQPSTWIDALKRRNQTAAWSREALAATTSVVEPYALLPDRLPSPTALPLRVKHPEIVLRHLQAMGVVKLEEVMASMASYLPTLYSDASHNASDPDAEYPVAARLAHQTLTLPLTQATTKEAVERLVACLMQAIA